MHLSTRPNFTLTIHHSMLNCIFKIYIVKMQGDVHLVGTYRVECIKRVQLPFRRTFSPVHLWWVL